ncbi:MAG: carbamoyl phosphate synthase small subunit [Peptococcia bacterium]
MKAYLCLQDGKVFIGKSIGLVGEAEGEVVYNTGMTGYQEIITDPACAGQIIVFTYPLIGNCGVNLADAESSWSRAKGVVLKELSHNPSNYRAEQNLHKYLVSQGLVGIKDVDTRDLTKHLRHYGTMRGLISSEENLTELVQKAKQLPAVTSSDLVQSVTTKGVYTFSDGQYPLVVVDLGVKKSLLTALRARDCRVILVGAETGAEEILSYKPWGVVFSNGPGDPNDVEYVLPVIRKILATHIPVLGIGLGHLLLGKALGGTTYQLKHGHRGNYPVKELSTGRVYMTSQNHGYALQNESFPVEEVELTLLNLHDQTIEGLRHKPTGSFSVQFNPEGCPGPREAECFLTQFINMVKEKGQRRDQDA